MLYPPDLVRGALYQGGPNDPNLYFYGGTVSYWNTSFPGFEGPASPTSALWTYDTQTKVWSAHDVSASVPYRPSSGGWAEAPNLGYLFYLNGEVDSGSQPSTQILGDYNTEYLNGMIIINSNSTTATNVSTVQMGSTAPRTNGGLQYLPGIGTQGILVSFGGTYGSATVVDTDDNIAYLSLDQIDVMDVASVYSADSSPQSEGSWYKQQATGTIPPIRRQFCTVLASAQDNSSHNIYIYGGSAPNNTFYDDVYVLSLPSFIWTRVYGPGPRGRYGHTCQRVGNNQMVSVGGAMPWGFNGPCDPVAKGLAVFDLSTVTWGSVYNATDQSYQVPSAVVATIGGSPTGAANLTQPVTGFDEDGLARVFNGTSTNSALSTTSAPVGSTPTPSSTNTGAIAGGVVGGVLFLAILALFAFLLRRRRRQSRQTQGLLPEQRPLNSAPSLLELAGRDGLYQHAELPAAEKPHLLSSGDEGVANERWELQGSEPVKK